MPVGRAAFHHYWPLSVGPERIYRSLRWGREVELFVIDTRQYADPLRKPDGPDKTMLGPEQLQWLREGVQRSDATWKVLVTSSPLSILRSPLPPHDDWVSYESELRSLLEGWRTAGVRNLVWLTADVHWGQAIEYPEWGMWEFVGAPIGASPRAVESPLSPTFGPRSTFLALGRRLYGSVRVDAEARTMAVTLKAQDGAPLHTEMLPAR
jgi:alkaline phosphatase D